MPENLTSVFQRLTMRLRALEARPQAALSYTNLAVNGGMEVWTAGVGPFTANGNACADTWILVVGGGNTLSALKDTIHQDVFYSATCIAATVVIASSVVSIKHTISGVFGGGPNSRVALSVRVKTSTSNAVRIRIGPSLYSDYHSGSGDYETLTIIGVPLSNPFDIAIDIGASCTAYIDNAMLVCGGSAIEYVGLTAQDNLRRITDY